jgi:steroid 5-alpha reductase family enzyme
LDERKNRRHPKFGPARISGMGLIILSALIAVALSIAMAGAWSIARKPGRSGWTDVIWSYAIGLAGVAAALAPIDGRPSKRQWLVAILVAGWSLRLGTHIALRTKSGHDDPRYLELRREWRGRFDGRLFGFLQIQAIAAWLLSVSILVAARNPAPPLCWSDWVGAVLLLSAVIGEAVADAQLTSFRRNPANRRRVCDTGLWSLSRHPNYFFEWLGWVAYAVIAIGPGGRFGWGWLALSGPIFMYGLLVHISGVPPLEAHMLRSHGNAFRSTQRRIRAFWPIPKFRIEKDRP